MQAGGLTLFAAALPELNLTATMGAYLHALSEAMDDPSMFFHTRTSGCASAADAADVRESCPAHYSGFEGTLNRRPSWLRAAECPTRDRGSCTPL